MLHLADRRIGIERAVPTEKPLERRTDDATLDCSPGRRHPDCRYSGGAPLLPKPAWSGGSSQLARWQSPPSAQTQATPDVSTQSSPFPSAEAARPRQERLTLRQRALRAGRASIQGLGAFWTKINNDWVFNLAAMLAYNLLMSIVPILAMFLSFFGLFLGGLAPGAEQQFISQMGAAIPSGSNLLVPALHRLAASSGIFAVLPSCSAPGLAPGSSSPSSNALA